MSAPEFPGWLTQPLPFHLTRELKILRSGDYVIVYSVYAYRQT